MTDDRRLTIGFPRMYNEPGERRAFLPPLIGLLASMDVDVYVEAGSGAGMGYLRRRLPGRVAEGAHRRRGHGVSPGHRGGAAGAGGALRADPARRDPALDAPLHHPAGTRRAAARPGHRGHRARHGHRRRRTAPRPEPARRGPQRRWPRPSTPSSGAGRRCSRRRARPSASRSWAPAGSASTPSSGRPSAATTRATSGSCARACPGSRSWWSSRTWPATRPTSGAAWR